MSDKEEKPKYTTHEALLAATLGDVFVLKHNIENISAEFTKKTEEAVSNIDRAAEMELERILEDIRGTGTVMMNKAQATSTAILSQQKAYQDDYHRSVTDFTKTLGKDTIEIINAAGQDAIKKINRSNIKQGSIFFLLVILLMLIFSGINGVAVYYIMNYEIQSQFDRLKQPPQPPKNR